MINQKKPRRNYILVGLIVGRNGMVIALPKGSSRIVICSSAHSIAKRDVLRGNRMRIATEPGTLFAVGVNYRTAPVEIREKLHLNDNELRSFISDVKETLGEVLVVSTCNRTEIYGVSETADVAVEALKRRLIELKGAQNYVLDEHFFAFISCAACQQLFNVATSIDSKVVGDTQILRQLRTAYSAAHDAGSAGKILNQLMQRAFKLGKTTYTQTSIHDGAISVSVAAVELAIRTLGSLRDKTALVVGTGETGRFTAEALLKKRVGKLIFTNRTRQRAEDLMASFSEEFQFDGEVVDFETFKERLPEVDLIIPSTGSEDAILFKEDFDCQVKRTLVIDLAVPRDVDASVAESPYVVLSNVDEVNLIIDENHGRRLRDLPKVKKMVTKEMVDFLSWYYLLPLMPEYEKTGVRASAEQRKEIVRIKESLLHHLPEIHRIAAEAGGDFRRDLESHKSLINKLKEMRPTQARPVAA